ncbi:uncharacterized protein LOC126810916 [Patella vulgata]|uniref:uncharacterized protein LOC126810916 n=1 Tax=Patella vulgata TaxID=6465 RepID=UPI00218025C0|nr:uncharacterized protein LOC126810916 [Patella vulgata]
MGHAASSKKETNPKSNRAEQLPGLKIVILGDSGVGKSSILVRYVHNQFTPIYTPTTKVSIDNIVKKLNIPDHVLVSLTFWDLPGKEDIELYRSYFTDVDAAIVVVDLSDPKFLNMALVWKQILMNNMTVTTVVDNTPGVKRHEEIYKKEPAPNKYTIPILLLGNKFDLVEKMTQNSEDSIQTSDNKLPCIKELEEYSAKYNFTGSMAVSAREGDGSVHQAIQSFIRHIIEKKYRPRKQEENNNDKLGSAPPVEKIFEISGIENIDKEFLKAEKCIRRIQSLSKYSDQSLKKFFAKCSQSNLTNSEDISLENCVVALKKYFCSPDTQLEMHEEDDFCTINLKTDKENIKMASCYEKIFKTFNLEYSASVKAILREFPDFISTLSNIDNRIEVLCQDNSCQQNLLNDKPVDYVEASLIIEKNRAKIKFTQNQATDRIMSAETSLKKMKTSLLW